MTSDWQQQTVDDPRRMLDKYFFLSYERFLIKNWVWAVFDQSRRYLSKCFNTISRVHILTQNTEIDVL